MPITAVPATCGCRLGAAAARRQLGSDRLWCAPYGAAQLSCEAVEVLGHPGGARPGKPAPRLKDKLGGTAFSRRFGLTVPSKSRTRPRPQASPAPFVLERTAPQHARRAADVSSWGSQHCSGAQSIPSLGKVRAQAPSKHTRCTSERQHEPRLYSQCCSRRLARPAAQRRRHGREQGARECGAHEAAPAFACPCLHEDRHERQHGRRGRHRDGLICLWSRAGVGQQASGKVDQAGRKGVLGGGQQGAGQLAGRNVGSPGRGGQGSAIHWAHAGPPRGGRAPPHAQQLAWRTSA